MIRLRIPHIKIKPTHYKICKFSDFSQKSSEAEEDKSLSEHSSGEARGHVSEMSLSLEPI